MIHLIQGKWLPLHTLAASGEFYLVDALLKHAININATDKRRVRLSRRRKVDLVDGENGSLLPPRSLLCVEEKVSDLLGDSPPRNRLGRHSVDIAEKGDELRRGRDTRKPSLSSESSHRNLPPGTFPVKVAIPVVPTIVVLVTFTKFEELRPLDEFSMPPLSPCLCSNESPKITMHIGWPLYRKYGHAYEAFRLIVNDLDSILNSLTCEIKEVGPDGKEVTKLVPAVSDEIKDALLINIRRR
ncbi:hypothetical protein IFM89_017196 [Coptis chinensis]|uniref:Ankyrin repeat domain-containing protein n=1 Tax=Coptis chinensis TaxID=261450 RepID=A0A835J0R9_9MAGN|nr:hypothetical protein IFM89_017196 [Coptis chinensis]